MNSKTHNNATQTAQLSDSFFLFFSDSATVPTNCSTNETSSAESRDTKFATFQKSLNFNALKFIRGLI